MEKIKAPVRVNYRPVSEDPSRKCSDCFFYDQPHERDDGNCFGHQVSSTGVCDAFSAPAGLMPDNASN
ncbi:hypothetical protein [Myxococcus landrumensis]|uniref:Uncharacterized protein n=1 Tax=Myxococcus landrumensis TaxID=2813577 RepID=A0ABX7NBP2_9BACT|nr:hypothetical protein [Myxococcus landrumus]QSQ15022.1 hypothetical protein JY572_02750 [Myxococcus landrumus]